MESTFTVIADPNRRAILTLLADAERAVGDIESALHIPQPSVSKHLRILRDAGFVEARVDAQRRLYRLKPEPLRQIDEWLAPFRRIWSGHVDSLERYLDSLNPPVPAGKALRKKAPRRGKRASTRNQESTR